MEHFVEIFALDATPRAYGADAATVRARTPTGVSSRLAASPAIAWDPCSSMAWDSQCMLATQSTAPATATEGLRGSTPWAPTHPRYVFLTKCVSTGGSGGVLFPLQV